MIDAFIAITSMAGSPACVTFRPESVPFRARPPVTPKVRINNQGYLVVDTWGSSPAPPAQSPLDILDYSIDQLLDRVMSGHPPIATAEERRRSEMIVTLQEGVVPDLNGLAQDIIDAE